MASLRISESFGLSAPPERVWPLLTDPAGIADCLPGAELEAVEGDAFIGTVRVKVGPVTVNYNGEVRFTEVDEGNRRLSMVGNGTDRRGGGSASLTLHSAVTEEDGGSRVSIDADVQIAGKLVRFGRGMFQAVSKQLLGEFSERLAKKLQGEGPVPGAESETLDTGKLLLRTLAGKLKRSDGD
ncbi:MAG TPA: SRPBCC family protein [Acidobacteriota bacterium]|nr:SRPBCC family protein [Acidobacteriota bacterium]